MIEAPQGIDRGLFLYRKFSKTVTNYCVDRKATYFDSINVFKPLKSRVQIIDDIIDMKFPQNEAFIADVAMPIVRKRWREINAFIRKYFENDPLVSYTALGDTPEENAKNRQSLVNRNFVSTDFREKAFRWMIDSAARYGTYVTFTQYVEKTGRNAGLTSVYDPNSVDPYQRIYPTTRKQNALTLPVHVLNYFCDPKRNCYTRGSWEGFIDCWPISTLFSLLNDENYIRENVESIIEKCKEGSTDQQWYGGQGEAELRDYSRATVNVTRMFTTLNFEGNHDDSTEYYVELIDNKIIRINESGLDENERPITTGTLINRTNVWWGNSDVEDIIPLQNVSIWLINTEIEGTMKLMDNPIFVQKGTLDVADWNNRHQLNGIVYYDEDRISPDKLAYQLQRRDNSLANLDWVQREIKQSIQESSPVVNMQNKYNEGGLNNSTLGAAQMVASIGEILQSDMMNNFSYGLMHIGKVSANILEIMLDEQFAIPVKNRSVVLQKHQIMGVFDMISESSMKLNDVTEFTKAVNHLTQFLNWRGTGDPAFQGVNIPKLIKDVVKYGKGWYSNVDDYYTEPQPQPIQQQQVPNQMQQPQLGAPV